MFGPDMMLHYAMESGDMSDEVSWPELEALLREATHGVSEDTLVWCEEALDDWLPLRTFRQRFVAHHGGQPSRELQPESEPVADGGSRGGGRRDWRPEVFQLMGRTDFQAGDLDLRQVRSLLEAALGMAPNSLVADTDGIAAAADEYFIQVQAAKEENEQAAADAAKREAAQLVRALPCSALLLAHLP